jgi:GT2 family glycosyltransferase
MTIAAVVPVWNGRDLLARLLDTLDAQTSRAAEIIVVDNGSTDGAPDLARERGARVIAMGRNAGFAAAVNRGIEEARSESTAVLNSDVELAPDYFARLMESMRGAGGADVWFASGKILDARRNGLLDGAFDLTSRGATTWRAGNGRPDGPAWSQPRRIVSPPWTAALFRREVFAKVGVLEPSFESYLEDVDFGLRCAAHGVSGMYVPDAIAWHHGSATLGRWHADTVRRMARNQVFLAARHLRPGCWWPTFVGQALWGAVAVRHGYTAAWGRGIWEGLRSFRRMRRERPASAPGLPDFLRKNEQAIADLQHGGSVEIYWRLYFLLTGGGAI